MTGNGQLWEAWDSRLRGWRGEVVTLPRETPARALDGNMDFLARELNVVLPPGTRVRYEETRYDSMRLDETHHMVRIQSGPSAGRRAAISDIVGPGPLPWEA